MNCGSEKGWFQHKAANTPPCQFCAPYNPKLAQPKKQPVVVDVRKKPGPKPKPKALRDLPKPRKQAVCGTPSGYGRHVRAKEPACQPCKDALAKAARDRRAELTPIPARKPSVCGTPAGYMKHRRNKEQACPPCNTANNAKSREANARKKAEKQ